MVRRPARHQRSSATRICQTDQAAFSGQPATNRPRARKRRKRTSAPCCRSRCRSTVRLRFRQPFRCHHDCIRPTQPATHTRRLSALGHPFPIAIIPLGREPRNRKLTAPIARHDNSTETGRRCPRAWRTGAAGGGAVAPRRAPRARIWLCQTGRSGGRHRPGPWRSVTPWRSDRAFGPPTRRPTGQRWGPGALPAAPTGVTLPARAFWSALRDASNWVSKLVVHFGSGALGDLGHLAAHALDAEQLDRRLPAGRLLAGQLRASIPQPDHPLARRVPVVTMA